MTSFQRFNIFRQVIFQELKAVKYTSYGRMLRIRSMKLEVILDVLMRITLLQMVQSLYKHGGDVSIFCL